MATEVNFTHEPIALTIKKRRKTMKKKEKTKKAQQAKNKKKGKKKWWVIGFLALCCIASVIQDEEPENIEPSTEIITETESQTEVANETELITETEHVTETPTERELALETTTEELTTAARSSNPLMNAALHTGNVMNGIGTEIIGEYAYIIFDKEMAKNLSMEQFTEFCNEVVADSGYNWFSICFTDDTCLCFHGCYASVATYGEIDEEHGIEEVIGTVMLTEDGIYEYSVAE